MNRKLWLLALAVTAITPVVLGAISPELDRPAAVNTADWISISDNAGIAVVSASASDKIVGRLYLKRGERWLEVSVENSPRTLK